MKHGGIMKIVRAYVLVGVAITVEEALWSKVLDDKLCNLMEKIMQPKKRLSR